jgi:hypothetical protein
MLRKTHVDDNDEDRRCSDQGGRELIQPEDVLDSFWMIWEFRTALGLRRRTSTLCRCEQRVWVRNENENEKGDVKHISSAQSHLQHPYDTDHGESAEKQRPH